MRRRTHVLLLAGAIAAAGLCGTAQPATADEPVQSQAGCTARVLVLSAYPGEADAVLSHTVLDADSAVVVDGHHFYLGTIESVPVIVAMTGIGLVNATLTTETAVEHFTCAAGASIRSIVFSGVAGGAGRTSIGDVTVPARWTLDDGATWRSVDPMLLGLAAALAPGVHGLARVNTAGDPACTCIDPDTVPIVDLGRQPGVIVGGDGMSSDGNNGEASPCLPGGGDLMGCQPCTAPDRLPPETDGFPLSILRFLNSGASPVSSKTYDAVDQETAAVQVVADDAGIPFIGFRGISDGPGDPLHLPGFPAQFFVYKQIAADNVATVVAAFLAAEANGVSLPAAPSLVLETTSAQASPAGVLASSREALPATGRGDVVMPALVGVGVAVYGARLSLRRRVPV